MFNTLTLGIVFIFSSFLYLFISFALWRLLPHEKSLKYFTFSSFFWIFGIILVVLRGTISDFFSVVISNLFLMVGSAALLHATQIYFGKIKYNKFKIFSLIYIFVTFYIFTYIYPSYKMRTISISLIFIIYSILTGLIFWRATGQELFKVYKITAIVFFTGTISYIISALLVQEASDTISALYSNKFIITIPYLHGIALTVWLSTALAIMCTSKLNRQLEKLNSELKNRVDEEVNERLKQQKLIIRQQKLATMGDMVSTIAHQWRQPLNTIHLIGQRLELISKSNEVKKEDISEISTDILKLTEYMKKRVENFRSYLNPNSADDNFTLETFISTISDIIETLLKDSNINIVYEYDFDLIKNITINGKINEFCEAILNIIINSKDAFYERSIQNAKILISIKAINETVIINIKDNAGGINDEIINSIFTPFFTTKSSKQGTGIGLYITKIIIQDRLGGNILFWNDALGASFEIILPSKQ